MSTSRVTHGGSFSGQEEHKEVITERNYERENCGKENRAETEEEKRIQRMEGQRTETQNVEYITKRREDVVERKERQAQAEEDETGKERDADPTTLSAGKRKTRREKGRKAKRR